MAEVPLKFPPVEGHSYGESINVEEYHNEVLRFTICRSTRADLRHKLEVIIRAHGGYRKKGLQKGAKALGVSRDCIYRWLQWRQVPETAKIWEKIDNIYHASVDLLVRRKLKRRQNDSKV